MKIAIIGGGVAGLATYLALRKHLDKHDIRIFEAYDIYADLAQDDDRCAPKSNDDATFALKLIGNAIGLSANGLKVLERLDTSRDLLQKVFRKGHPISKWQMSAARGRQLVDINVSPEADGKSQSELYEAVMITRQTFWQILRDAVLSINSHAIAVARIAEIDLSQPAVVDIIMHDGGREKFDLVIGADGLKSIVRKSMFPLSNGSIDLVTPRYEGLTGVGGFVPSSVLEKAGYRSGTMSINFGANGFFGYGNVTDNADHATTTAQTTPTSSWTASGEHNIATWWSTFTSSEPYPFAPPAGNSIADDKASFDHAAALRSVCARHQSWKLPAVQEILRYVSENGGPEHCYPTYTTKQLPTLQQDGKVVLVGDAGHAFQPTSGQGASQALEDAEALALLLKHHLEIGEAEAGREHDIEMVAQALEAFVAFRQPRLSRIYTQSQKMSKMKSDMNFLQEMLMYLAMWIVVKLKIMKSYNKWLLGYDLPRELQKFLEYREKSDLH